MRNTLRMGAPIEEYRKLGIMHGQARKRFKYQRFKRSEIQTSFLFISRDTQLQP